MSTYKSLSAIAYEEYLGERDGFYYKNTSTKTQMNFFAIPPIPDRTKWVISSNNYWTYVMSKETSFPNQGWKIHVTSTLAEAQSLLYSVATYLIARKVSFKFVPTPEAWKMKNSKYADRAAAGKFITIYPSDENSFIKLLSGVRESIQAYDLGPYILNDKQWQNSNVFYRYGGMKSVFQYVDSVEQMVIQSPDGSYIPDKRIPAYAPPSFVVEPEEVRKTNFSDTEPTDSPFFDYSFKKAVHYSDAGGIYEAEQNGKKIVIKEGRRECGLDAINQDGFQRNRNEFIALKHLSTVESVANVYDYFTAWRHNYFTEEFIEGITLQDFIAKNYPFNIKQNRSSSSDEYLRKTTSVVEQLRIALEEIHAGGYAICDLSLTNVLIEEDTFSVRLIDFEVAKPVKSPFIPQLVTRGFSTMQAVDCEEQDWFAWDRIWRCLLLPSGPLLDLAPSVFYKQNMMIIDKFGEGASLKIHEWERYAADRVTSLHGTGVALKSLSPLKENLTLTSIPHVETMLANGISKDIEPTNFQMTFGDINQYLTFMGSYNIANGAFGILLSLSRTSKLTGWEPDQNVLDWITNVLPLLLEESKKQSADFGLYTGLSGIAMSLYEIGFSAQAHEILQNLLANFAIESMEDVSVYSGLSGIGISLLSIAEDNKDHSYDDLLKRICEKLQKLYVAGNGVKINSEIGLITGWCGALLFVWKYSIFKESSYLDTFVRRVVNDFAEELTKFGKNKHDYYPIDNSNGSSRFIPYLENGAAGIALALYEIMKDEPAFLPPAVNSSFETLLESANLSHSYNAGLFSGYAGLLIPAKASLSYGKSDSNFNEKLSNLGYYLLQESENVLCPGYFGYKCSMDYATGAAGIMLVLEDLVSENRWDHWFPVLSKSIELFRRDHD